MKRRWAVVVPAEYWPEDVYKEFDTEEEADDYLEKYVPSALIWEGVARVKRVGGGRKASELRTGTVKLVIH